MSDKSLILTIGLTDKFDEKWGVVSKHKTQQLSSLYNLKLLDPDSVKETVSWRLNMDNPYVVKIIAAWEKAIRRPHLKMMCHMHTEFDMDPSYLDMRRYMEIVPLIPSLPQEQLDMSIDLSQDCGLVSDLPWGSIGTSVYQILNFNDITTKLIDAGDLHDGEVSDPDINLIPKFNSNMDLPIIFTNDYELQKHSRKLTEKRKLTNINELYKFKAEYAMRNLDSLKAKEYNEQAIINIMARQWLVIGELINTPGETYEKLSSLPYICSMTLTEE
tara:strand:+ start:104 stop:922 length:819 start_codon:yes stop_codon:yes gene_type:complete